jgi:hypothetical protein
MTQVKTLPSREKGSMTFLRANCLGMSFLKVLVVGGPHRAVLRGQERDVEFLGEGEGDIVLSHEPPAHEHLAEISAACLQNREGRLKMFRRDEPLVCQEGGQPPVGRVLLQPCCHASIVREKGNNGKPKKCLQVSSFRFQVKDLKAKEVRLGSEGAASFLLLPET